MRESVWFWRMMVIGVVILLCTAAGCINFSGMLPGISQAGPGTSGSGSGSSQPAGSGGGSGSGTGAGGAAPWSGIPPTPPDDGGAAGGSLPAGGKGDELPLSDLKTTPMYTYFTVNCHAITKMADEDHTDSIEDVTVTGEIPIEMVKEYNDWEEIMINFISTGLALNLRYSYQSFCPPDDQFCEPCKQTYQGPVSGGAYIERAPSGGATDWVATITVSGPADYNRLCSNWDPKGTYCPPRYPSYSDTGEIRIATPPVQDTCVTGVSPDLLLESIGAVECGINEAPFVLREGEVITNKQKNEISEYSYESVDATYTFHISAK